MHRIWRGRRLVAFGMPFGPAGRASGTTLVRVLSAVWVLALSACATLSPEHQLERAYWQERTAPKLFDAFFEDWERRLPALTAAEIAALPNVERAVYEIFAIFYTPGDLGRLGAPSDYVYDVPYYVVQNSVGYLVVDRLLPPYKVWNADFSQFFTPRTLEEGRIGDFRPRLEVGDKRVVFLSKAYDKALGAFLEERGDELLSHWISVSPGHWGGWEYITFPTVNRISIDERLTNASLDWWIGPYGGQAFFERVESGWKMVSSEAILIQ